MTDNEITFDLSGLFAQQADVWDRAISERDTARDWAVALEQDNAAALALVDGILDHAPEECDCDDDGSVCVWHKLRDVLRGEW